MEQKKAGAPPAQKAHQRTRTMEGYNQTYCVFRHAPHSNPSPFRDMFFRCGNFCYRGNLDLGMNAPTLADFPTLIPTLQSQQVRADCSPHSRRPAALASRAVKLTWPLRVVSEGARRTHRNDGRSSLWLDGGRRVAAPCRQS